MEDFQKNIFCCFRKQLSLEIDTLNSSDEKVVLRGNLKNVEDVEIFIEDLKKATHTDWVCYFETKNANKFIYHKVWICQRSSRYKTPEGYRNAGCLAKLDIKIKKINYNTKKNDKYLCIDPPLQCIIKLGLSHSHETNTPLSLRMLRVNKEVRMIFFQYFNLDMGPTESQRCHQQILMENESPEVMANASVNPTLRQINHLYQIWRKKSFDFGDSLSQSLEKMPLCDEKEDRNQVSESESNCTIVEKTDISCPHIMKRVESTSMPEFLVKIDAELLVSGKTPETSGILQDSNADEILENPSVSVDATLLSKTSEKAQKLCRTMSDLTSELTEDPAITVITLCCTDTKEGTAFHKFLQDPEQRMRWISKTKCQNLKPSHIRVLCPKHFDEEPENCQSEFKENRVQNVFSINPSSQEKDVELFEMWKDVIPLNHEEETTDGEISELYGNHKEIDKIYVKVSCNESVSKNPEKVHSLQPDTVPSNLQNPIRSPRKAKKRFMDPVVRIKRLRTDRMYPENVTNLDNSQKRPIHLPKATRTELINYVKTKLKTVTASYFGNIKNSSTVNSENSATKITDIIKPDLNKIHSINSSSDKVREKSDIIISSVDTVTDFVEKNENNSFCDSVKEQIDVDTSHSKFIEKGTCLNNSRSGTEIGSTNAAGFLKIVNVEGGIDPLNFQTSTEIKDIIKYDNCIRTIKVPNAWWGITHTPQYIICSKWNECYEPIFRVIIEKDNNVKIFIKGRECTHKNRKISFENISSLLQEIDSYEICAGIGDKRMKDCLGHLENESQGPYSIWCKECQKRGKELMNSYKLSK